MIWHLLAFALHAFLFTLGGAVLALYLRRVPWLPTGATLACAGVCLSLLGYLAFWVWLGSVRLGFVFTCTVWLGFGVLAFRTRAGLRTLGDRDVLLPVLLIAGCLLLQVGVLHLYRTDLPIDKLAATRFLGHLPVDNEIPRLFAERLLHGQSPRQLIGDWLSSDRPPLQTGVILLTLPIAQLLKLPLAEHAHAASWFCQVLWIPAVWTVLRSARVSSGTSTLIAAVLVLSGQTLLHGLYVWPKLYAAALVLIAWAFCFATTAQPTKRLAVAGVCAALAWLAHGGAAFSLLAMAPLIALLRRPPLPAMLAAATTCALLAIPWMAYQKFYEPPGNRLLKWHLAGVIPPDERGFGETWVDAHARLSASEIIANKRANFIRLAEVWPREWFGGSREQSERRRISHFYDLLHATTPWLFAGVLLPLLFRRRAAAARFASVLIAWTIATVVLWALLMFGPGTTLIHQGSLAVPLVALLAAAVVALEFHPAVFAALAAWQVWHFVTTWLPPSHRIEGPVSAPAVAILVTSVAALAAVVWIGLRDHRVSD